ncbi:Hypothetical protein SMAX5B_011469 [Scophthalmus maximus]|uniref:Uncharacterized protein n=1 Tax=Scophthalmus maximus TaxID=52904 RepID=A0A2U9BMW5_SCOMX|nr:Hypothetical protein SMAX5B_011469 [Scophthalmus maximus]
MGGPGGRLQRCLIDVQSQSDCQRPSQTWETRSTISTDFVEKPPRIFRLSFTPLFMWTPLSDQTAKQASEGTPDSAN